MKIYIKNWQSHHNMLLYSAYYYCTINNIKLEVFLDKKLKSAALLISFKDKFLFFDYSDDVLFIENPKNYDFYFKRSLLPKFYKENVYPLNFQINYSFNPIGILSIFSKKLFVDAKSRIELFRALDFFKILTNQSHFSSLSKNIKINKKTNNGKIIFQTRLWNPNNSSDSDERERRELQNEFRINAVREIRKNFKNSIVGIYPEPFSEKVCSDILLNKNQITKKNYIKSLYNSDIAIADDGLKDTPGWKIGEYLLYGKAVVSTPINTVVEDFHDLKHYIKLSDRNSYLEITEKIELLLENDYYREIGYNGYNWAKEKLAIENYFENILKKVF